MSTEIEFPSQFPLEMLTEIFKYLSVVDRKSVKLVNKRWKEACNAKCITDTEKFFFSGIYPAKKLLKALSTTDRNYLNLEFDTADLLLISHYWEEFGSRISSITLTNCKMREETIAQLIINCTNLTSLTWRVNPFIAPFCSCRSTLILPSPFTEALFQKLVDLKVVHEKLKNFDVPMKFEGLIAVEFITNIFLVLPNIDKLRIFDREMSIVPLIQSLLDYPAYLPRIHLEELSYKKTNEFSSDLLKKIKINRADFVDDDIKPISNFPKINDHLKSARFFILGYLQIEINQFENLVTRVLDSHPSLRCLKLSVFSFTAVHTGEFMSRVLNSSLNTFITNQLHIELDSICDDSLPINRTVRILCLGPGVVNYNTENALHPLPCANSYLIFLKSFSYLEHLTLHCMSFLLLKCVMETHKNLKSLRLMFPVLEETMMSFSHVFSETYVHEKLEYLRLASINDYPVIGLVLKMLYVPNLRFIEIDNIPETVIPELQVHAPLLESISVGTSSDFSFDLWYNCAKNLQKLRILVVKTLLQNVRFSDENYTQLLQSCPWLHYLEHKSPSRTIRCFYNVLKKEICFDVFMPARSFAHSLNPYVIDKKWSQIGFF